MSIPEPRLTQPRTPPGSPAVGAVPPTAGGADAPLDALADQLIASGIRTFLGVPGHPVTELLEGLEARGCRVLDPQNEKTAAEMAIGSSLAGTAVALVVKGNGALLAAEPLQNAGPHGIAAPLLLIVGDDVLAERSTVPTDARPLGQMLHLPVLDLPSGTLLRPTVAAAVAASRSAARPVIVRFTGSLLTAPRGDHPPVTWAPSVTAGVRRFDPSGTTKLSRSLDFSVTRAPELQDVADAAPSEERGGDSRRGVLAVGSCGAMLGPEETADPVLAITCAVPLPRRVVEFCSSLDQVLVLEEGAPTVEDELQRLLGRAGLDCEVQGQRSGAVPPMGATGPATVTNALLGGTVPGPTLEPRPPERGVEAHEYRVLFQALAEVHATTGVAVHSCVGSCISIAYPPYALAASALNLGGATGVAAGAALADGQPCIALIGDYGLIHSGLDAHDQIQRRNLPVLTVVLANGRSAKTGGQPSAVGAAAPGQVPFDLRAAVSRSSGPDRVRMVRIEDRDTSELRDLLMSMLDAAPATLVVVAGQDLAGVRG